MKSSRVATFNFENINQRIKMTNMMPVVIAIAWPEIRVSKD
jgi:hypothetical protein